MAPPRIRRRILLVGKTVRKSFGCGAPTKGSSVRISGHLMRPAASLEFLGAIIGGDKDTAITHRITEAWAKFWSLKTIVCSRTL